MYFDTTGLLLKTISFGKQHNMDLNLLDKINIYQYNSKKVKYKIDVWQTDYKKNVSHKYYKIFDLDSTNSNIISKKTFKIETDSIFTHTDYWYNKEGQYQGIIFDSTYYYKREYNEKGKLTCLQQIYESKLRWEWKYTYSNNQRIGTFYTYYNNGKNYSKEKEIKTYNNQGVLIEIEQLHITKDGLDRKTKIVYNQNGVIERIEYYYSYNKEEGYEMISYSDIKIKSKIKIDSLISNRINKHINIE
jgi:hypothetical protein